MRKTHLPEERSIYKKKRRLFLVDLLGGECIECGTKERLQFDHVIPEAKKFNIAQGLDYSLERLLEELQKCQLLCISCHSNKTVTDIGNKPSYHGGLSMYVNRKCRCEPCKKAWKEYFVPYQRAFRARQAESAVV